MKIKKDRWNEKETLTKKTKLHLETSNHAVTFLEASAAAAAGARAGAGFKLPHVSLSSETSL